MATSISSQLRAIKSVLKGAEDPVRRPITRPSILFDAKEAADIDLRTILPVAILGLDFLVEADARFRSYKETLFGEVSLEIDREKLVPEEESKMNRSICSYLRLLAGHLELPASLKTLEYLIRRYHVHVFNMDELVLCALPYHGTPAFVRIVQLLYLGPRRRRSFSMGGRLFASGEALGSIPKLDTDIVQRVISFVFDCLNPEMGGSHDHKAGALMVVGLLATRATLEAKLVQNLIFFIARVGQHDAKQSSDLPWIRVTIMAIISLVQSQSAQPFSKKTMMMLNEIR